MTESLRNQLKPGDRRTTGAADTITQEVLAKPDLFPEVLDGLDDPDAGVRMRSADVIEKVSAAKPDLLYPYKQRLIKLAKTASQQEVQWHLAQILGRLPLSGHEIQIVYQILTHYIDTTKSKIVQVFSLQTLTDLATKQPALLSAVYQKIQIVAQHNAPSVVSRSKKLLAVLDKLREQKGPDA